MNNRRKLVIAIGASALTAPLGSLAQQQGKVWRIGTLTVGNPQLASSSRSLEMFTQGLRELGYVEGGNIIIERRYANSQLERLPALTAELVQAKVDVIFVTSTAALSGAKEAAGTIPIVFSAASDPVGNGFAASLARPGGNITGASSVNEDLSAKRLQLLKEAFPKISRLAVFTPSKEGISNTIFMEVRRAAAALKIEVLPIEITRIEDFASGFTRLTKLRADSIFVISSNITVQNRKLLTDFATKARLPAMFPESRYTEVGGLMSYGPDYDALYRRGATYVDKILKGAKPGDLPIEQPTKFDLVVNMKTAKTLGIKIPNSILVMATKVIE